MTLRQLAACVDDAIEDGYGDCEVKIQDTDENTEVADFGIDDAIPFEGDFVIMWQKSALVNRNRD